MVASVHRSLITAFVVATATIASAETLGGSDSDVWRWHVTNILRAQQDTPDQLRTHHIVRAGPFLADGSGAPSAEPDRH
jgi:hypothetical protein